MSVFLANTLVSVLRGTETDAYGDVADSAAVVPGLEGVPAAITEQSEGGAAAGVQRADSGRERNVRTAIGRLITRYDVRVGDRVRDDRRGLLFIVDSVSTQVSMALNDSYRLELRRID